MQLIKLVAIGMLVWGNSASADLSSGGDQLDSQLVRIQSRAARLNGEFTDLRLRPREDISSSDIAEKTMQDLRDLEVVLHDTSIVPAHKLMNVACAKAFCFQD